MTETLISLISIFIGIAGANLTGVFFKKYSFGLTGNTIVGVFGSVFFIKSIGRLGFDPMSILQSGNVNVTLLIVNLLISFCGGMMAVILLKMLIKRINE